MKLKDAFIRAAIVTQANHDTSLRFCLPFQLITLQSPFQSIVFSSDKPSDDVETYCAVNEADETRKRMARLWYIPESSYATSHGLMITRASFEGAFAFLSPKKIVKTLSGKNNPFSIEQPIEGAFSITLLESGEFTFMCYVRDSDPKYQAGSAELPFVEAGSMWIAEGPSRFLFQKESEIIKLLPKETRWLLAFGQGGLAKQYPS